MNSFTISQLQRYSGISVHSIRAWEKRYNALKPNRSEGNTRYYDGNQLKRLLNIASLMDENYKVSYLCSLSDSGLTELLDKKFEGNNSSTEDNEFLVSQLVASALQFNETLFEKVFSRAVISNGLEGTYLNVLYPTMQRLGVMWTTDRIAPAQEHFIINLIRQKINTSIDLLPLNSNSKNRWLLFLPENEFHESGLLIANYLLRNAGHRCTYLGANVPFDTLKQAVKIIKPDSLLFFFVSKDDEQEDKKYISLLHKTFPSQKIFLAGDPGRLSKIKMAKNFTLLQSVNDLKKALKSVSK